jgi:hypothetical protein
VLRGSVGTGTKGNELITGHVWAAIYHHVKARLRLARFEIYEPFIDLILIFFGPR